MSKKPAILSPIINGKENQRLRFLRNKMKYAGLKSRKHDAEKLVLWALIKHHTTMLDQLKYQLRMQKKQEHDQHDIYFEFYDAFRKTKRDIEATPRRIKRL